MANKSFKSVEAVGRALEKGLENGRRKALQRENVQTMKEGFERLQENKEYVQTRTEALPIEQGNGSELYVTAIADFVEDALRPDLIAMDVMNTISLDMSGQDSLKIPVDELMSMASDLPDDGSLPTEETEWDSTTLTVSWVAHRTEFTQQLLEVAPVDLLTRRLERLAWGIERKINSDVISSLSDATPSDEENDNYNSISGDVAFDDLIDLIGDHRDLYARPDTILISNKQWKALMKDSDMKDALAFSTSPQGDIKMVQNFGDLKIIPNSEIGDNDIYLVDSQECGYFLDGTPVRTFDGRIGETVNHEVAAIKGYDVGVVRPHAVYRLECNVA